MGAKQSSFAYDDFARILSEFLEREVLLSLVKSIVEHPERFTGPFRPSTHKEKLLQHMLQSREILFGDAIEEVFAEILTASGYLRLDRMLQQKSQKGETSKLECDLFFKTPDGSRLLLVEQKLRDDHDSSKRVGQVDNFRQKVDFICRNYKEPLYALMHFVDPAFRKNRKFYSETLRTVESTGAVKDVPLYGGELMEYLEKELKAPLVAKWSDLMEWLQTWKQSVKRPFDEMLDWDEDENINRLREIALEHPKWFEQLATRRSKKRRLLWEEGWLQTLSPKGDGLRSVVEALSKADNPQSHHASRVLGKTLEEYYRQQT